MHPFACTEELEWTLTVTDTPVTYSRVAREYFRPGW